MLKSSILLALLPATLLAEPLKTSWFTTNSGQYARLYEDNAAMAAQNAVTTWSRGAGTQSQPTYAGVSEVAFDATNVYIRTPNLGFHVMGPWYNNGNLFPNYPSNVADVFRIPRTPTINGVKTPTGGGTIGYFVDGVAMFDSRDAFSYSNSDGEDEDPGNRTTVNGDNVWLRDAFVNEGNTFDNGNAHQAGNNYHYHANPPGLRHLLGDSVDYDPVSNTYTETPNGSHSPIIGWCRDGLPIYGPYGYSDPTDPSSLVRRMISGYQKRDGTNGSTNLPVTGRTTLPQWVVRNEAAVTTTVLNPGVYGPDVDALINGETYVLGRYLQDYAYKEDLTGYDLYEGVAIDGAHNPSSDFDLNEYNVRFTVTPEFPAGTWAYFTNIEPDGTPSFPYNIARYYYAEPLGDSPADIPVGATTIWEGGPEAPLALTETSIDDPSGDVTLTWSTIEGGQYLIESSPNLSDPWTPLAAPLADGPSTVITDPARANGDDSYFYRARFDYIAPFDDAGFVYDNSIVSTGPQNNVLLLILDDWGIDSSALYNSPGAGIQLADMPNLETLANAGLLFTRGYSQPICSPTRATILTGRQPYQHTVGNPQANATLPASELTFPEIMATEAPDYGLASFGKWHLGSGNTGPFDTGGWPNFSGTQGGGVADYAAWTRIKIENGVATDTGTDINTLVPGTYSSPYATSVQVDEAVSFITAQGTDPWVVWMGFNAPHDPFHDPEPYVTIPGGYSTSGTTNKDYYVKMLEALDHEIGRLLASVDLSKTNIIVVGDNGTPGQVDQAPAGGIAGAKGSLNEGGIHVPFFACGPDVTVTGTTDKMVHVVDLFATILDLTKVNVSAATAGIDIHSRSILPIFRGTDMEDRCVIAEKFGLNVNTDGRALMMDDWPDYKLTSIQDVTDPLDTPVYQMYELGTNGVELTTLTTPPNPGDPHEAAYNALVAKDQSLVPAAQVIVTVDIDLPTSGVTPAVPPLINANNGNIVRPNGITIGGVAATWDTGDITVGGITTSAARVDELGNPDRYSVVATFDLGNSGLTSGVSYPIVVSFPGGGGSRIFTATNQYTVP